jgi:hypothetical protein
VAPIVFTDRFTYANPAFEALDIDTVPEQTAIAASPAYGEMLGMVRRHSVVLSKTRHGQLYYAITEHADPRIALLLAAKRRKADLLPMFANMDAVKEAMFGPPDDSTPIFENSSLNIFVDGIRRVSAALAAATLIGQLAQVTQQFEHSKWLEQQALIDLAEILKAADLVLETPSTPAGDATRLEEKAFFFQDATLELGAETLRAEVFMPSAGNAGWVLVRNYTGSLTTQTIVAEIADKINELTLTSAQSNIVAAPILASAGNQSRIEVSARLRDVSISYELISIRFSLLTPGLASLPFQWGVNNLVLSNELINSAILRVQVGRVSAVPTGAAQNKLDNLGEPIVLYFRRSPEDTQNAGNVLASDGRSLPVAQWEAGVLTFRIAPFMTEAVTVPIPRLLTPDPLDQATQDRQRQGQVAEALVESLYSTKNTTRTLGVLMRNDPPTLSVALAGVELVAFRITNPETYTTLDVLSIPADIDMAVGDLSGPLTPFSNRPRSIRVATRFERNQAATTALDGAGGAPSVDRFPRSQKMQEVNDRYGLYVPGARSRHTAY